MEIFAKRCVCGVLENVSELAGDFRKTRKTVAGRSAAESVGRDVQTFEIFAARSNFLKHADVFPQILQVFRGFLEEDFDGFAVRYAHARPSVTSSAFWTSSAVGLRYRMQSFKTIA